MMVNLRSIIRPIAVASIFLLFTSCSAPPENRIKDKIAECIRVKFERTYYSGMDRAFSQFVQDLSGGGSFAGNPIVFIELKSVGMYSVLGGYWPIEARVEGKYIHLKGSGGESIIFKYIGNYVSSAKSVGHRWRG
jgi:hypothetical protein